MEPVGSRCRGFKIQVTNPPGNRRVRHLDLDCRPALRDAHRDRTELDLQTPYWDGV